MKRILFASMAIALVCTCFISCGGGDSPVDTVKVFMTNVSEGNAEAAYNMLCESSQQQITLEELGIGSNRDDLPISEEARKEQEETLGKMSYELAEESENEAVVYVTHADYPSAYHTISLVKENNAWKIDFFNSSLLTAAQESADEKTCMANMRMIIAASEIYAASNDGVYPTSMDDLIPEYVEEEENNPFCPLDGSPYTIVWSAEAPPEISCPNHGSP